MLWTIRWWYLRMLAGYKKLIFVSGFSSSWNTAAFAGRALPVSLLLYLCWNSSDGEAEAEMCCKTASLELDAAEMDFLLNCPKSRNDSCWFVGKYFHIMDTFAGIGGGSWEINDSREDWFCPHSEFRHRVSVVYFYCFGVTATILIHSGGELGSE